MILILTNYQTKNQNIRGFQDINDEIMNIYKKLNYLEPLLETTYLQLVYLKSVKT